MAPGEARQFVETLTENKNAASSRRRCALVVEDDSASRQFIARILEDAQYKTIPVANGEDAVRSWERHRPDVVLMDLELPGINGYETTHQIKALAADQWVPVIFVTAHTDDATLSACFDAGGDDFIAKPVNKQALTARVNAVMRRSESYRAQYHERRELAYFRNMVETEQEIAHRVFQSIMDRDRLDLPNIRYSLSPMSIFNGDLLLAAEKPDGDTNLLIGDFTGHGLAASIGSLPTAEIFYAMTAKGFGIVDVMAEINRRLCGLLPVGIFLAACGVEFNSGLRSAQVWNGGIPDVLIRRAGGAELEQLPGLHVPIGVLGEDEFDGTVDLVDVNPGDRFYIYTDGVIETESLAGDQLGLPSLRRIVRYTSEDDRVFSRILERVDTFRAGREQSDDVTLLEYTCSEHAGLLVLDRVPSEVKPPRGLRSDWSLHLDLDADAVRMFDPRPVVTQTLMDIQGVYEMRQRLYLVVADLYSAVLEHGVLGLDPTEKADPSLHAAYQRKLIERLHSLESGGVAIDLAHKKMPAGGKLKIAMRVTPDTQSSVVTSKYNFGRLQRLQKLCERVQFDASAAGLSAECHWNFLDD